MREGDELLTVNCAEKLEESFECWQSTKSWKLRCRFCFLKEKKLKKWGIQENYDKNAIRFQAIQSAALNPQFQNTSPTFSSNFWYEISQNKRKTTLSENFLPYYIQNTSIFMENYIFALISFSSILLGKLFVSFTQSFCILYFFVCL